MKDREQKYNRKP